jgi:hypothetical protein
MLRSVFIQGRSWELSVGLTSCGRDAPRVIFHGAGEIRCADGQGVTADELRTVPLEMIVGWFFQTVPCPPPDQPERREPRVGRPERSRVPYRLDPVGRIAEIIGPAFQNPYALGDAIAAILVDPRFDARYGFLRDHRGLPPPSADFVRRWVALVNGDPLLRGARWAVVADDPASFGLARMASTLARGIVIEVFKTRSEAVHWLVRTTPPGST